MNNSSNVEDPATSRETFSSPAGVIWTLQNSEAYLPGRTPAENIFSVKPGPTSYCYRNIIDGSPYTALKLFIGESMLRIILRHTLNPDKKTNKDFSLNIEDP